MMPRPPRLPAGDRQQPRTVTQIHLPQNRQQSNRDKTRMVCYETNLKDLALTVVVIFDRSEWPFSSAQYLNLVPHLPQTAARLPQYRSLPGSSGHLPGCPGLAQEENTVGTQLRSLGPLEDAGSMCATVGFTRCHSGAESPARVSWVEGWRNRKDDRNREGSVLVRMWQRPGECLPGWCVLSSLLIPGRTK